MARRDRYSSRRSDAGSGKKRRSRSRPGYVRPKKKPRRSRRDMTPEQVVEVLQDVNFSENVPATSPEASARLSRIVLVIAGIVAAAALLTLASLSLGITTQAWQERRAGALTAAVGAGDLERAEVLIERGADVMAAGPDAETPLEASVRTNQPEAATLLIAAGAPVTDRSLRIAMGYGHREVLLVLLNEGGNPNVRDSWLHRSLLEWAIDRSDTEMATVLLEAGADPNSSHALSMPALHLAASQGKAGMVGLLLDYGASPSLRWHRQNAADAAMLAREDQIAEMLRELEGD